MYSNTFGKMNPRTQSPLLTIAFVATMLSYSTAKIEDCSALQPLRQCATSSTTDPPPVKDCFIPRKLANKTMETELRKRGMNNSLDNLTMCALGWRPKRHKQLPCAIEGKDDHGLVYGVILTKYDIVCVRRSIVLKKSGGFENFYEYEVDYSYNNSPLVEVIKDDDHVTASVTYENGNVTDGVADENVGYMTASQTNQTERTVYISLIIMFICTNVFTLTLYCREKSKHKPCIEQRLDPESLDLVQN